MIESPARLNEIITFLASLDATLSRIAEGQYRIICQCLLLVYKMYLKGNNLALIMKLPISFDKSDINVIYTPDYHFELFCLDICF